MRIWKFRGEFFAGFKCADDRRTPTRLDREHARPVVVDPTELFHFIERFPHSDEASAATGWIKNDIWQFPIQLFGDLVTKRFLSFDTIRLFQRGKIEPAFLFFFLGGLGVAIGNESIVLADVRADVAILQTVRAARVPRHPDLALYSG